MEEVGGGRPDGREQMERVERAEGVGGQRVWTGQESRGCMRKEEEEGGGHGGSGAGAVCCWVEGSKGRVRGGGA